MLGSYESLEEADLLEVLEDFTGGLSEFYDIATDDDSQERLFRTLKEETENKTLVSAIIAVSLCQSSCFSCSFLITLFFSL